MGKLISTRFVFLAGLLGMLMPFGMAGDSFLGGFDRFEPLPDPLYSPGELEDDPTGFFNYTYPRTTPFPSHYRDYGMFLRPPATSPSGAENTYNSGISARLDSEGADTLGDRLFFTDDANT